MSFNSPVIFFYFFASGALSAAPISSSFTANFIKTRGATAMKKLIAAIGIGRSERDNFGDYIYLLYITHDKTRRELLRTVAIFCYYLL